MPEDGDIDKAVSIAQTTIVELCKYVHISFLLWEERSSVYGMFTCIIIIP